MKMRAALPLQATSLARSRSSVTLRWSGSRRWPRGVLGQGLGALHAGDLAFGHLGRFGWAEEEEEEIAADRGCMSWGPVELKSRALSCKPLNRNGMAALLHTVPQSGQTAVGPKSAERQCALT
jgi:hypothetical protein